MPRSRPVKVCSEPGCPNIQPEPRCPAHTRQRDRARGTRTQRGYGTDHDRLRARWAPLVATGLIQCWRCHLLIPAGAPWDLGHDDRDRSRYAGPEHRACNRATAGRHPAR